MIVTEAELRDQVRRPTIGAQVRIPPGARLSPSATDFVKHWQLVVLETEHATPGTAPGGADEGRREWDTPSTFPISTSAEPPRCTQCGTPVPQKPDALTQLNACHLAAKTHPRIRLRGRVDTLHALVLLAQSRARGLDVGWLADELGTVAAYCREVTSAEYNERPVADLAVDGRDAEAIHRATHDPEGELGVAHLTISDASPELQHWLNLCRATARELELVALDAFDSPHHPYGASICHALNRLSSAFYFLQLRLAQEVRQ